MSRSVRSNPVCGMTCAKSEKQDKALQHRALRAAVRGALANGSDIPRQRRRWMSKDGKQRFNPTTYPKGMRK